MPDVSMPDVESTRIFAVAPAGSSAPDSLTLDNNGSVWVEYGNGANTTGAGGSSTIVQYDTLGRVENTFTIAGSADGLKFDPVTDDIFVLQNQDGNSTLSLIDPMTNQVSGPLNYAVASPTRGFDDVAFVKGNVFESHTNPAAPGDGVVELLDNGHSPFGTLQTTPILRLGDTGTDMTTGATNVPLPVNDPDSLKALADGTLVLTSGQDSALTFIHNPATPSQTESFVTLPAGTAGLDDAITTNGATSGTFFVADTATNLVSAVQVSGLNPNDVYASVASDKGIVQIDPNTGVVTPVATGFQSPHGMFFVPAGSEMPSTDMLGTALNLQVADLHDLTSHDLIDRLDQHQTDDGNMATVTDHPFA